MGSASYAPENDAVLWKIKSFPGGKVNFHSNVLMYIYYQVLLILMIIVCFSYVNNIRLVVLLTMCRSIC